MNARTICPCCKSPVERKLPIVDLNTNTVSFGGVLEKLKPAHAELLYALVECSPRTATHDHIISRLWGGSEPAEATKAIHVYICQLRRVLRNTPFDIVNVFRSGYRLERRKETANAA